MMWRNLEVIACVVVFLMALSMIIWNFISGFSSSIFISFMIIALISLFYFFKALKDKNNN